MLRYRIPDRRSAVCRELPIQRWLSGTAQDQQLPLVARRRPWRYVASVVQAWVSNWVSITVDFRGHNEMHDRLRKPLDLPQNLLLNDWGSRGREFKSPQPDTKLQVRGYVKAGRPGVVGRDVCSSYIRRCAVVRL